MKKILVLGAGGFIGSYLVASLKAKGYYVVGADLKYPEFRQSAADEFHKIDLRDASAVDRIVTKDIFEIYQLAADMGGAGYIFTGENDADIMHNSATINLNICHEMVKKGVNRVFYTSSACIYPAHNQLDPNNPFLSEESAYPANPDSEYGWEKLFSERVFLAFAKNYGLRVRIARLHNVFGPYGSWNNGKEKAPAALCRKVALSNGVVDIWGSGTQTRSFLYINECIEGIHRLMNSEFSQPINIGSDRMLSINDLAMMIANIAGKDIKLNHIEGPLGVAGRNSYNKLIKQQLNWAPADTLKVGLEHTYGWIHNEINKKT